MFERRRLQANLNKVKEKMGLQEAVDRTPMHEGVPEAVDSLATLSEALGEVMTVFERRQQTLATLMAEDEQLISVATKLKDTIKEQDPKRDFALLEKSLSTFIEEHSRLTPLYESFSDSISLKVLRFADIFRARELKTAEDQKKLYNKILIDLDNATSELVANSNRKDRRQDGKVEEHYADAQIAYDTTGPETVKIVSGTSLIAEVVLLETLMRYTTLSSNFFSSAAQIQSEIQPVLHNLQTDLTAIKATSRQQSPVFDEWMLREEVKTQPQIRYFGVSLTDLCDREGSEVPYIFLNALHWLQNNGVYDHVGIFRLSGRKILMDELKEKINDTCVVDFSSITEIDAVAGLIKQWLRELPEPLIPFAVQEEIIAAMAIPSDMDRLKKIRAIIFNLPPPFVKSLSLMMSLLHKIVQNSAVNKMTPSSLATVMGPNIMYSKVQDMSDPSYFQRVAAESQTFTYLIQHTPTLFPIFELPAEVLPANQKVPKGAGFHKIVEEEERKLAKKHPHLRDKDAEKKEKEKEEKDKKDEKEKKEREKRETKEEKEKEKQEKQEKKEKEKEEKEKEKEKEKKEKEEKDKKEKEEKDKKDEEEKKEKMSFGAKLKSIANKDVSKKEKKEKGEDEKEEKKDKEEKKKARAASSPITPAPSTPAPLTTSTPAPSSSTPSPSPPPPSDTPSPPPPTTPPPPAPTPAPAPASPSPPPKLDLSSAPSSSASSSSPLSPHPLPATPSAPSLTGSRKPPPPVPPPKKPLPTPNPNPNPASNPTPSPQPLPPTPALVSPRSPTANEPESKPPSSATSSSSSSTSPAVAEVFIPLDDLQFFQPIVQEGEDAKAKDEENEVVAVVIPDDDEDEEEETKKEKIDVD